MNTVITDSIPAHIENGRIVPDAPIEWADGTRVWLGTTVEESEKDDVFVGGRLTGAEVEAWWREAERRPPLFADAAQREEFERFLAESKAEQKEMIRRRWAAGTIE